MKETKKPGIRRRNKHERSAHLDYISRLMAQGYNLTQIAERLDLSVNTVWNDAKKIKEGWQKRSDRNRGEVVAKELAKLDLIEHEAWKAWEKSKQEQRTRVIKQVREQGRDSDKQYVEQRLTECTGDPRYFTTLLQCHEKRCALLGIPDHSEAQAELQSAMGQQMLRALAEMAQAEQFIPGPTGIVLPSKGNGQDHGADSLADAESDPEA